MQDHSPSFSTSTATQPASTSSTNRAGALQPQQLNPAFHATPSRQTAPSLVPPLPHHRRNSDRDDVAVVLGTRPEIVKLAGLVSHLGQHARIIHTGQHYDPALSPIFFDEFGIAAPDVSLDVGGKHRGEQIGDAVSAITQHLIDSPARAVVVQGDTNAALAGAMAANATSTPLLHIEAGLRSFDRSMPEEHNRVVIDHLADRCCAPTKVTADNLRAEGISARRIAVTGNTVIDAVARLMPASDQREKLLDQYALNPRAFILSTFHRPENVDHRDRLVSILRQLRAFDLPVLLALHPRTQQRIAGWQLHGELDGLRVVEPMAYREFLGLALEAACLISDSGGIQEEASAIKRPVAVVRRSTERPEVIGTFAQLVPNVTALRSVVNAWLTDIGEIHQRLESLDSPYGDGKATQRCAAELEALIDDHVPSHRKAFAR